jgi:GTP cyclohydrolase II
MSRATKRNPIDPLTKARLQWTALSDLAQDNKDTIIAKHILKWFDYVKMKPVLKDSTRVYKAIDEYFLAVMGEVQEHLKSKNTQLKLIDLS